jgi:gluconolactonase
MMRVPGPSQIGLAGIEALVEGLDHPEGVAYGADGYGYAGGEAGQIYRIDLDRREVVEIASTGCWVLGIVLDAEHNIYACDPKRHRVFRVSPAGSVVEYSSGTATRPLVTPNYPVFDAAGNLYVSDSSQWPAGRGCIFRIAPGGGTTVWTEEPARFANGLALSPDGTSLYVVESVRPGVVRIPIRADGSAGPLEVVVELPTTVPDGLAFDSAGTLFISCYRPDRIYRLSPDGALTILAEDWQGTVLSAPTNIAFAGPGLDALLIASLGRWHLGRLPMSVPGQPLHYPRCG